MPTINQIKNQRVPLIALIGLPNSGKSTLLNKITGENIAITAKEEHTTRDLNYGEDFWEGMYMRFVDTGGLVPNPEDKIQKEIQIKSWSAIAQADLLVWLIDRKQNPDTISQEMLKKLWQTGKKFIIAINKVDDPNLDKDIAPYAQFGGIGFINVSATNGYGLGDLMDLIVEELDRQGFEKTILEEVVEEVQAKRKRSKTRTVHADGLGHYYITREEDEEGDNLFNVEEEEEDKYSNQINNIIFDFFGVCVQPDEQQFLDKITETLKLNESQQEKLKPLLVKNKFGKRLNNIAFDSIEFWEMFKEITGAKDEFRTEFEDISNQTLSYSETLLTFIQKEKEAGKKLYYLTNISEQQFNHVKTLPFFEYFDGGIASWEVETSKPSPDIYKKILKQYGLDANATLYIDDKESMVKTGREIGMWAVKYKETKTDLDEELEKIERGFVKRIPEPPKIVLLGRPNVGKSSLFNALCDEDLQIVTEIAGTTLSVNDYLIQQPERDREYLLMDTAGIRKPGQRTFGVESFATYRTIQAAQEADVICLVLDASQPITHQDQVVAGVIKEANKGLVVIANKSDLVDEEMKEKFLRDFYGKFKFLKVDKFIWTSSEDYKNHKNEEKNAGKVFDIFYAVDYALFNSKKTINQEEVRKLFNYLMKKRPPKKLRLKKKPVIYGLTFKHPSPPTFELMIKDKETIHWSYVRFLENMLRKQFHLNSTGVKVKIKELPKSDRPKHT